MTNRTIDDKFLGAEAGDGSDVNRYAIESANDVVEATHESWPESGQVVATEPGARIHLFTYPDSTEGRAPTAEIPAVPPSDPIPANIEGPLTLSGTFNVGQTITDADTAIDRTADQFIVLDQVAVPASPSGVLWEQGNGTDGAYCGFVGGELVIRNGTGGDARFDGELLADQTGTLYLHLNPSAGSMSAWWLKDGDIQAIALGIASSGTPGDWAGTSGGSVGQVAGSANIEGGSAVPPNVRDSKTVMRVGGGGSTVADMPNHQAGDKLVTIVTMHNNGQSGAATAQLPGASRRLNFRGKNSVWAPAMFIWEQVATSDDEQITVTCQGPTKDWQRSITVMAIENAGQVSANLGSAQGAGPSTIGFDAADAGSALAIHVHSSASPENLNGVPGDTVASQNDPEYRGHQVGYTTSLGAAVVGVEQDPHTSATISVAGDVVNEGLAAFNGTINEARFYKNTPQPGNMLAEGVFGDPGTPIIPAAAATTYATGSPSTPWPNADLGRVLESVRPRLVQSRTGAGLWAARAFTVDDSGRTLYAPTIHRFTDVETDSGFVDRLGAAVASFSDGTDVNTAIGNGWPVGLLLEAVSVDETSLFGEARLDVASIRFSWVHPPTATIIYPAASSLAATVTPSVGWTLLDDDQQSAYRVRIWSDYDSDNPNSNVVYDSGRIVSRSARSHQVTRPLLPDSGYYVGVQSEGLQVNGRAAVANWVTHQFSTGEESAAPTTVAAPVAADNGDGSVTITGVDSHADQIGTYALIERASKAELDAARVASVEAAPKLVAESFDARAPGWMTTNSVNVPAAVQYYEWEWFGRLNWLVEDTRTLFEHGDEENVRAGISLWGHPENFDFNQPPPNPTPTLLGTPQAAGDLVVDALYAGEIGYRARLDAPLQTMTLSMSVDGGNTWVIAQTWLTGVVDPQVAAVNAPMYLNYRPGDPDQAINGHVRRFTFNVDGTMYADVDIDRDATADAASFTDAAGNTWQRQSTATVIKPEGQTSDRDVGLTSQSNGLAGATLQAVPASVIAAKYDEGFAHMVEWSGTLAVPAGTLVEENIFEASASDGPTLSLHTRESAGNKMWMKVWDPAGGSISKSTENVPFGQRVHVRMLVARHATDAAVDMAIAWSEDGGATWTRDAATSGIGSDGGANFATFEMNPVNGTGEITIGNATGQGPGVAGSSITESVRWFDLTSGTTLVDAILGRDVPDVPAALGAGNFISGVGNVWLLGSQADLFILPSVVFGVDGELDVWEPVTPVRATGLKPRSSGDRLSFVDHSPPQGVGLVYRIRPVLETAPFATASTVWAETGEVTVTPRSWWITNQDGVRAELDRVPEHDLERPANAQVAANLAGEDFHVSTSRVRKPTFTISVDTLTEAAKLRFIEVASSDGVLTLQNVHGDSWFVQRVGGITTTQINAHKLLTEPWPIRYSHRHTINVVTVPRAEELGYGDRTYAAG